MTVVLDDTTLGAAPRPHRRRRLHDRRGRDRARARRRAARHDPAAGGRARRRAARAPRPKGTRRCGCTTCSRRTRCSRRCRCTRACCRSSSGCSTAGCLLSGMTAIDIGPGEDAQPMHGDDIVMSRHLAAPARPDDGHEHVGAHRLHRRERRHPLRPRLAPLARHPDEPALDRARRARARDAGGLGDDLPRQPLARRRREHDRRRVAAAA